MQAEIADEPWQTDTCVGGWFYDVRRVYKTPKHVIEMLVNIVSKNGNLLLNFTQKPDGTLDDECLYILDCMAKWIKVNGEGIYDTRPWKVAGEGPLLAPESGSFKESEMEWSSEDYRFTAKGDTLYAFQMKWPENPQALIKSLAKDNAPEVVAVNLLGFDGRVEFEQNENGLSVKTPQTELDEFAHCFRIQFNG